MDQNQFFRQNSEEITRKVLINLWMPDTIQLKTFDTPGTTRNVCFVTQQGEIAAYNYAYLVTFKLLTEGIKNSLLLKFSSFNVTLKGYHLHLLFDMLTTGTLQLISTKKETHLPLHQADEAIVTEIYFS